jgi:hypothetical protein
VSVHHGEQELNGRFVLGLFLLVLLCIALMIGAGLGLAWFAEKVA